MLLLLQEDHDALHNVLKYLTRADFSNLLLTAMEYDRFRLVYMLRSGALYRNINLALPDLREGAAHYGYFKSLVELSKRHIQRTPSNLIAHLIIARNLPMFQLIQAQMVELPHLNGELLNYLVARRAHQKLFHDLVQMEAKEPTSGIKYLKEWISSNPLVEAFLEWLNEWSDTTRLNVTWLFKRNIVTWISRNQLDYGNFVWQQTCLSLQKGMITLPCHTDMETTNLQNTLVLPLEWIVSTGNLDLLKDIHELMNQDKYSGYTLSVWNEELMHEAAIHGHIHILEWLNVNYPSIAKCPHAKTIHKVAANGHMTALKWLHTHKKDTIKATTDAMNMAALHGHSEIVQWLHQNRSEGCSITGIRWALSQGHLEIVVFFYTHYRNVWTSTLLSKEALKLAVHKHHIDLIRWLVSKGQEEGNGEVFPCTLETLRAAISIGGYDMEFVRWLCSHIKYDDGKDEAEQDQEQEEEQEKISLCLDNMVKQNDLQILQLIYENYPKITTCTEESVCTAARLGNQLILEWLDTTFGAECFPLSILVPSVCDALLQEKSIELVKWLVNKWLVYNSYVWETPFQNLQEDPLYGILLFTCQDDKYVEIFEWVYVLHTVDIRCYVPTEHVTKNLFEKACLNRANCIAKFLWFQHVSASGGNINRSLFFPSNVTFPFEMAYKADNMEMLRWLFEFVYTEEDFINQRYLLFSYNTDFKTYTTAIEKPLHFFYDLDSVDREIFSMYKPWKFYEWDSSNVQEHFAMGRYIKPVAEYLRLLQEKVPSFLKNTTTHHLSLLNLGRVDLLSDEYLVGALRSGNGVSMDLLVWFRENPSKLPPVSKHVLITITKLPHGIPLLKIYFDQGDIPQDKMIDWIEAIILTTARHGHLETLKWAIELLKSNSSIEKVQELIPSVLDIASEKSHINMVLWLIDRFSHEQKDRCKKIQQVFNIAILSGQLITVKYLVLQCPTVPFKLASASLTAEASGCLLEEMILYLVIHDRVEDEQAIIQWSIKNYMFDVLKYYKETEPKKIDEKEMLSYAISNGKWLLVKWLVQLNPELMIKCHPLTINRSMHRLEMDHIKWLLFNGKFMVENPDEWYSHILRAPVEILVTKSLRENERLKNRLLFQSLFQIARKSMSPDWITRWTTILEAIEIENEGWIESIKKLLDF